VSERIWCVCVYDMCAHRQHFPAAEISTVWTTASLLHNTSIVVHRQHIGAAESSEINFSTSFSRQDCCLSLSTATQWLTDTPVHKGPFSISTIPCKLTKSLCLVVAALGIFQGTTFVYFSALQDFCRVVIGPRCVNSKKSLICFVKTGAGLLFEMQSYLCRFDKGSYYIFHGMESNLGRAAPLCHYSFTIICIGSLIAQCVIKTQLEIDFPLPRWYWVAVIIYSQLINWNLYGDTLIL